LRWRELGKTLPQFATTKTTKSALHHVGTTALGRPLGRNRQNTRLATRTVAIHPLPKRGQRSRAHRTQALFFKEGGTNEVSDGCFRANAVRPYRTTKSALHHVVTTALGSSAERYKPNAVETAICRLKQKQAKTQCLDLGNDKATSFPVAF